MDKEEKLALTHINKIPLFRDIIRKLTINAALDQREKIYILSCAIIFLDHYRKDNRFTSFAELSYYIILKYGVGYQDYRPLYDFAANFGYYPIVRSILENSLIPAQNLDDCCLDIELGRFRNDAYIETLHQYREKRGLLADETSEMSYIAPTSFGKSSVIIDCIHKYATVGTKIGIVVPTKSLLMQTYRMVRNANLGMKIIIHDEMYQGETAFIAIFTQERSLRLLSKFAVHFDVLFIDEAHNLLKDDSRSILLSRLLKTNRALNPAQKVIYLSPLIDDIANLKVAAEQQINTHKIAFSIKEPEIYEYRIDKEVYKYNRFVNEHYQVGQASGLFAYIVENARAKNFLYNYRPVNIEKLARDLAAFLNEKVVSPQITELIRILKQEVHEKFYAVDYIEYGIIYLHGKLPDLIKEYLESKFRDLQEINYIIANSVILEGMNLPIDNLYILNTRGLYGKELTNLIGRVNRLNTIFTPNANNLNKLLPRVHFINSDEYNRKDGNMRAQIELLRSRTFKDKVENPILAEFDIDNLKIQKDQKESKTDAVKLIQENESFLSRVPANEQERLKKYLIESGIAAFYGNLDELVVILLSRIAGARNDSGWNLLGVMEKIAELFIREIAIIKDVEFSRLRYPEAQRYYNFVITISQRRALKENINHMFTNFKKRVKLGQPVTYFGETYGEVEGPARLKESTAKTFINLAQKSDTELVNLAIVKIKIEEDFVSFKLNKFIIMLYDYELISIDDYNKYIYGTTDRNKIELTKIGLSVSLISRLETDDQLRYIYFDEFNNLKARTEFEAYKISANDFYRFEIERFLN